MKKALWLIAIALIISLPAYGWMLSPIVSSTPVGADATKPTLSSVAANGDDWTFTYSENVTATDDGDMCDGYTVTMSTAGALTFTYLSGTRGSTNVFHCTSSSAIVNGETITTGIDYTPGTIADNSANTMNALDDWTTDFTNTTPAATYCAGASDADVMCEDFNASTLCATTYTSTCENTWTAAISGSGTIDFDSTLNIASNTCSSAGSYWFDVYDATFTDGDTAYVYLEHAALSFQEISFVVYLDDVVAQMGDTSDVVAVARAYASGAVAYLVYVYNTGAGMAWMLYDIENANALVQASGTIPADNTLYEIKVKWDVTGNTQELIVNGTSVATDTQTITRQPYQIFIGFNNSTGISGQVMRAQFGAIKMDDDSYPDTCDSF